MHALARDARLVAGSAAVPDAARSCDRATDRRAALPSRRSRRRRPGGGRVLLNRDLRREMPRRRGVEIQRVLRVRTGPRSARRTRAARSTSASMSPSRSNARPRPRRRRSRATARGPTRRGAADRSACLRARVAPKPCQIDRRSARRTPSGGSCSCAWIQRAERLVEQPLRLRLGQHREQRIDARLDRTLAQQLGAEAVNGADVRFLERLQRLVQRDRARRPARPSRATSSASRSRSFSSPAAFSVKVTATMPSHARRGRSRGCGRSGSTSSVVLPVPAAASTTSVSSSAFGDRSRACASASAAALPGQAVMASPAARRDRPASRGALLRDAARLVGAADRQEVAPRARALAGRRRQEAELDGAVDDLERLEADAAVRAR